MSAGESPKSKPIPVKGHVTSDGFATPGSPPRHVERSYAPGSSPSHRYPSGSTPPQCTYSPDKYHHHPTHGHMRIPSPVPSRRTRTTSISRMASESELQHGTIIAFCREKGHGFIKADDEEKPIFLHISDIEDEYVVQVGDRVQFRSIPMPPKCVERQAVEVCIEEMNPNELHPRWDNQPDV